MASLLKPAVKPMLEKKQDSAHWRKPHLKVSQMSKLMAFSQKQAARKEKCITSAETQGRMEARTWQI